MKKLINIILLVLLLSTSYTHANEKNFMDFIMNNKVMQVSDIEYKNFYNLFLSNLKFSDSPRIIILSGTPGAGKSTFRKKYLGTIENFHLHDMDEVIANLKGYKVDSQKHGETYAFDKWWPIAQKVVNQLTLYAFTQKFNIVYDRSCCTEQSLNDLREAVLHRGYKAKMYAFYVPEVIALDRVKKRAIKDNRADIPETVVQCGKRFSAMFANYVSFLNEITLYCHEKICLRKENDLISIVDNKAYEEFLDYGKQQSN